MRARYRIQRLERQMWPVGLAEQWYSALQAADVMVGRIAKLGGKPHQSMTAEELEAAAKEAAISRTEPGQFLANLLIENVTD